MQNSAIWTLLTSDSLIFEPSINSQKTVKMAIKARKTVPRMLCHCFIKQFTHNSQLQQLITGYYTDIRPTKCPRNEENRSPNKSRLRRPTSSKHSECSYLNNLNHLLLLTKSRWTHTVLTLQWAQLEHVQSFIDKPAGCTSTWPVSQVLLMPQIQTANHFTFQFSPQYRACPHSDSQAFSQVLNTFQALQCGRRLTNM